jgi:hypothetical protein
MPNKNENRVIGKVGFDNVDITRLGLYCYRYAPEDNTRAILFRMILMYYSNVIKIDKTVLDKIAILCFEVHLRDP